METRTTGNPDLKQRASETKSKTSKLILGLTIGIVVISLTANILLLCFEEYIRQYFLGVNMLTGISLVAILLLSVYCRKIIKGLQRDYIHRIFHKN